MKRVSTLAHDDRDHARSSARALVFVWGALLMLLALTLASAYVRLGWMNGAVNLAIAATKTLLVMVWFMHLRRSLPVLKAAAAAGFVMLAILGGLALADVLLRNG